MTAQRRKEKQKMPNLSVPMGHVGSWTGELGAVIEVGGIRHVTSPRSVVRRGGYIWIGNPEYGGKCYGCIGIGKFLQLARAIERVRRDQKSKSPRPASRRARKPNRKGE